MDPEECNAVDGVCPDGYTYIKGKCVKDITPPITLAEEDEPKDTEN